MKNHYQVIIKYSVNGEILVSSFADIIGHSCLNAVDIAKDKIYNKFLKSFYNLNCKVFMTEVSCIIKN